ncbi:hypothetical protein HHI36_019783 [Cryptolaemus montrouzieri]|uniref:Uncharacterized protein n=1 Tax=Cryptolaemus montrouzieri TaxID=559131 RepID=A0ABD2N880_9CUCU
MILLSLGDIYAINSTKYYTKKFTSSKKMKYFRDVLLLVAYLANFATAGNPAHPHLHAEVRIVGYHGPTNKHILKLFRGAEILEMIDCNVTTSPALLFSELPKLRILHLENNTYQDVDYETVMHGAHKLEEFYFININQKRIYTGTLGVLPRLRICVIRGFKNPVKSLEANVLNETVLEELEFSSSGLEEIHDSAFNGLDKLKILNLSNNKLKGLSKTALTPLKSLKILNLEGNEIETFSADGLPDLPNLEEINLSNNPLSKLNLDDIGKVAPKLKTIKETSIADAEVKKLRKKTKLAIIDKNE